mgnify:CR=1 FL=1
MTDTIDLNAERVRRHPSPYVDVNKILAAAAEIDSLAHAITVASMERHGAVDVIAYELCAYASAIRRTVAI